MFYSDQQGQPNVYNADRGHRKSLQDLKQPNTNSNLLNKAPNLHQQTQVSIVQSRTIIKNVFLLETC